MSELEWAILGYDKREKCEFIDRQPDSRADAEERIKRWYSDPRGNRDVRVVCRNVGEWTDPTTPTPPATVGQAGSGEALADAEATVRDELIDGNLGAVDHSLPVVMREYDRRGRLIEEMRAMERLRSTWQRFVEVAREVDDRSAHLDELVSHAEEHGLYEATAEPLPPGVHDVMRLNGIDPDTYRPPIVSSSNTTPLTPAPDEAREVLKRLMELEDQLVTYPLDWREAWAEARRVLGETK